VIATSPLGRTPPAPNRPHPLSIRNSGMFVITSHSKEWPVAVAGLPAVFDIEVINIDAPTGDSMVRARVMCQSVPDDITAAANLVLKCLVA